MSGASSGPEVSFTKVEKNTPDISPSSEEVHPYRSLRDRGRVKAKVNNGESTRWQKRSINTGPLLFNWWNTSNFRVHLTPESSSDETGSLPTHCVCPE